MNTLRDTAAGFTALDWMLAALLLYSTLRALARGLLLEVVSLLGMAAGVLLAGWNYAALATHLVVWLTPLTTLSIGLANIIAFFAILLATTLAAGLVGRALRTGASAIGLGIFDRLGGAAFGLVRGWLLGVALTLALTAFNATPTFVTSSRLFPYFLAGAHGVSFVVPGTLQQELAAGTARIKHTTSLWINPSR